MQPDGMPQNLPGPGSGPLNFLFVEGQTAAGDAIDSIISIAAEGTASVMS